VNERVRLLRKTHLKRGSDGFASFDRTTNRYLCGFSGSTSAVLVTQKAAVFITDFRYREQSETEVESFERKETKRSLVVALAKEAQKRNVRTLAFEPTRLVFQTYHQFQRRFPSLKFRSADGWVEKLRQVKEAQEVAAIKKAAAIADRTYLQIALSLRGGMTEREVSASIDHLIRLNGASGSAFETIVLFGCRSSMPHGAPSDARLEVGDLVLMDFGACHDGYNSDLTRTVIFGKIVNREVRKIYNTVLKAQGAALKAVKSGVRVAEVDRIARNTIAAAGYGKCFGHALGHGVGLEVHEGPTLSAKGKHTLVAGNVVTIEPGIYVPGVGGVRVEDLVEVTKGGHNVLSSAPKGLTVINPP